MENEKSTRDSYIECIKGFRLLDDVFMTACLDNNIPAVHLILKIILGMDLTITEVRAQDTFKNLNGRDVRLDVFAKDESGREIDIEVQRSSKGASPRRARYNSSMLDSHMLAAGKDPRKDLRDSYVIFITEKDVFGKKLPLYHIDRYIREDGFDAPFGDGSHIIYVNGAYRSKRNQIGKLMHDFRCRDANRIYFSELKKTVKRFKETDKGVDKVCEALEKLCSQAEERGEARGEARGEERGIKIGAKNADIESASRLLRFSDGDMELVVKVYPDLNEDDRYQAARNAGFEYEGVRVPKTE